MYVDAKSSPHNSRRMPPTMEMNFFALIKIIQLVLPSMGERKNRTIVNIGSFAGIDSRPSCGIYSPSKHGPEGKSPILVSATRHSHFTAMTESLSKGVAPFNITCFIVEPYGS
jgi:NADP-dependent 3-hydroxy acid dehydrogenase YdfG